MRVCICIYIYIYLYIEWVEDRVMTAALLGSSCECCGVQALTAYTAEILKEYVI